MIITYYGHSCFAIMVNGKKLLFDPSITGNPLAKDIELKAVEADYILISHGHNDHIADAVEIALRTKATIVCNGEIARWMEKQGVSNIHEMNIGGKWKFDFGYVKCVIALHSSSMDDGTYGGNPMGFIIESSEQDFYYSGDTALTYDMKLIGEYRKVDFAFLCIGDNYTMSVDNAIIASDFIKCDKIIGMHYDTFKEIKIDKKIATDKFRHAGKELILIEVGASMEIINESKVSFNKS